MLGGSQSQVRAAQFLHGFRVSRSLHPSPSGRPPGRLKDGHHVEGHTCLTSRDVGLPIRAEVEFEARDSGGLIGPIQRELLGGARKHVHKLRVGR